MDGDLKVRNDLIIPAAELEEQASRGGGPGGQHVNKTSTRITLRWSVRDSQVLVERQRAWLLERLRKQITRDGELVVHASDSRSQHDNRKRARERLAHLVRKALIRPKRRRRTRPSRAARRRRLEGKRRRGKLKKLRGRVRNEK